MEETLYPDRARHRAAHELFMADFTEHARRAAQEQGSSPLSLVWLKRAAPPTVTRFHIRVNDAPLAAFLARRGPRGARWTHRRAGRTARRVVPARRNRPVFRGPRGVAACRRSSRPRGQAPDAGREQLLHLGAQEPVVRVRGRGLADRQRAALAGGAPRSRSRRTSRRAPRARRQRLGLVRARPRLALALGERESSPNQRSHAPGSAGPARHRRQALRRRSRSATRAARAARPPSVPRRFSTSPPPTAKPCSSQPAGSASSNAPRSGSVPSPNATRARPGQGFPGGPAARHQHRAVEPRQRRARAPRHRRRAGRPAPPPAR